ncbi:hypothetical protein [Amycolatopsis sp. NPDC059021]|uniref:hypothetical protein n=1 Tax=Amycolatopsis sp. NPDC059021 TaxID=3346704 RepID=UPI0036727FE6
MTMPSATWGAAVTRGLRHGLHQGADAIVIADPEVPADVDAPAAESAMAAALHELPFIPNTGVVSCPLRTPWWQQLLSLHVLRPLCAPALGRPLHDYRARTLVLTAPVAAAALAPRWGLERLTWETGHGLAIIAAARHIGLGVSETQLRRPDPEAVQPTRALIDQAEAEAILPTALQLAGMEPPLYRPPQGRHSWTGDLTTSPPPPASLRAAIASALDTEPGDTAYVTRGTAAGWPGPLVEAWHAARTHHPHLSTITQRLWRAYLARLTGWLPTTITPGVSVDVPAGSVTAAARAFLAATSPTSLGPYVAATPHPDREPS